MTALLLGIVLAGGQSRRMGRSKADIVWRGRSLLDHARDVLRSAGAQRVIVLGRPDLPDGEADAVLGGPARALEAALARYGKGYATAIVIPVDMPLMTRKLLATLTAHAPAHYAGTPLPCALPMSALKPGDSSMFGLLRANSAATLDRPAGSDAAFSNVNTPHDLAALEPW